MIIIGAGGFGRELLETILLANIQDSVFFFDNVNVARGPIFDKFQVISTLDEARRIYLEQSPDFAIGIGAPQFRERLTLDHLAIGGKPSTIISPNCQIGKFQVNIGKGTCIMSGSILTTCVTVGEGCLININCTIGHDAIIGPYSALNPGVHISGGAQIGSRCEIGTGAVVLPMIRIGNDVRIGAGAVVTTEIPDGVTAVGVPARIVTARKT